MAVYPADGVKSVTEIGGDLFPFPGGNWNSLERSNLLLMIRLHHLTHQIALHVRGGQTFPKAMEN